MVVNQATLRSIGVGFSTLFNRAFENTETTWEKVATKVTSDTKEQEYGWLGQFPQMREWIGSREVQKMLLHGYTIRNKTYESTIGVKREDIEDDNYGTYGHLVSGMGEAAAQHPDTLVWGLLMEGFTQRCYDGKPFFSDQHLIGDEKSKKKASNMLHKKLSPESYAEARAMIMSQLGDNRKSLKIIPNTLFVSPTNETMGRKILECEFIDGSSNPLRNTASLEVITDLAEKPDFWFLGCTNKALKPVIFQERKPLKFQSFVDDNDLNVFLKNEYLYGVDGRHNVGFGFWQLMAGSDGTVAGE